MGKELSRPIRSISASVSKIADRNVTSTKIEDLTDLFVKIRKDYEGAAATKTFAFNSLNRDLSDTVKTFNRIFVSFSSLLESQKKIFETNVQMLFADVGQTSDFCKNIYRANLDAEFQLYIVLNQRIDEAKLEGINKKLQEDILPSNMTFLTGPNFQLNSFLKYRNAKQIHGGDYLTKSSNLALDYFPETDLRKIKLSSYTTVNGLFLLDPPGTQNSTNIDIYTNVTLTSSDTNHPQVILMINWIAIIGIMDGLLEDIPGRNETTSKMDSLVDSYQSYGDIIASNFSQREPTFDKLHDDLFELMKEINKKFYPSSVLLEKTEANFKKNFPIVYAQANDAKDFCDKAFKGSNELETQVADLIADLMSKTLLDGINKKLQEDILPSNMTFLTGLNFQLNSFLKFRKAKQIDGGDYLAKSSNLETDYFPETDFTKIKLTSYATVNGSFLLDPPGTPGLGNSIVSTQGTLPANISFPRDLSAFTVYAQEIIPLN
uniref:Uncharacterized protein n=1 Tax=Tetranychus urticae TaxID=32264 RepID=T1JWV1_TETUR